MKKLITLVLTTVISVVVFAQNLPAFTDAENAYVFDAKKLEEDFGDGCRIVNLSFEENLSFDVYVMKSNKKKWLLAGSGTVNGIMDTCDLKSEYDGDFDDYRYFALVPKDKREYKVQFTYDSAFFGVSREVCVFLVDVYNADFPAAIKKNSTIIDVESIKGKFKDNIKLINKSDDSNMDFLIFGFDVKDAEKWETVGKSYLKEYGDTDNIDTPINDSSNSKKYKFYAIYAKNSKKYDVNPSKAHNDLYIEIK